MSKKYHQFIKEAKNNLDVKTPSVEKIAKKHDVSVSQIENQLKKGIKVEKEHTTDIKTAKEIALDHLSEYPDYYDRLEKVEENMNIKVINEAKLSRVIHHFKSPDTAIGIISRFRDPRHNAKNPDGTLDEKKVKRNHQNNLKANQETARVFRKNGYGYVWVDGVWIENEGTKDERKASEVSIFVTAPIDEEEKLLKILLQEGKKKSKVDGQPQDAVIFKGSDSKIKIIDPVSGKTDVQLSSLSVDKISFAYTRLRSGSHRGRTFVFENIEERTTWAGKLIEAHKNQRTLTSS